VKADEFLRAEYVRLCRQAKLRLGLYEQMKLRHKDEAEALYGDVMAATAERDRFAKDHPEARP
jgi:hypothetical protein